MRRASALDVCTCSAEEIVPVLVTHNYEGEIKIALRKKTSSPVCGVVAWGGTLNAS